MASLWNLDRIATWRTALESYDAVVARQGVERLAKLDGWYREVLPGLIAKRRPMHVTRDELARLTEWKMSRGVWRPRNLALVRGNNPELVVEVSAAGLAAVPDPRKPIAEIATLAGVGPATASAVAAAAAPAVYPFFDELVAAQVPGTGPVAFKLPYYLRYAEALRGRAARLGADWTPVMVERALWAEVGGKAGRATPPETARPPKGRTAKGPPSR